MDSEQKIVAAILAGIVLLSTALFIMDYAWCRSEGYSAFQCLHSSFFGMVRKGNE